jgi:hypothetical protein
MLNQKKGNGKKGTEKPVDVFFDENRQQYVVKVTDSRALYPCCWQDPEAGQRQIKRTKNKGIQMC